MICVWETEDMGFEFKIEDIWCEQLMRNAKELPTIIKNGWLKGEE